MQNNIRLKKKIKIMEWKMVENCYGSLFKEIDLETSSLLWKQQKNATATVKILHKNFEGRRKGN